jgi:Putative peptidoglycan binding domain
MKGLVVFRWLMPAALAALLSIPVQTVSAHPSGGGHAMGGHGMGGTNGRGMGGRPSTSSHFFSRNGANHSGWDHHFDRFTDRHDHFFDHRDQFRDSHGLPDRFADRRDHFSDRADRFRDHHFEREGFEREEHEFFFRHNFFVGFDFAAFGFPGWGPWGPWWWYPDYADYPYYDDPPSSDSQTSSGSQYGTQYWNDLAMSVQSKLAQQSYYRGPIDGVIGSGSLQAIRRFQSDHGLPVTGRIDPKLLKALGVQYKAQS